MESDFLLEIGFFAPICRGLGVECNCARSLSLKKNLWFLALWFDVFSDQYKLELWLSV